MADGWYWSLMLLQLSLLRGSTTTTGGINGWSLRRPAQTISLQVSPLMEAPNLLDTVALFIILEKPHTCSLSSGASWGEVWIGRKEVGGYNFRGFVVMEGLEAPDMWQALGMHFQRVCMWLIWRGCRPDFRWFSSGTVLKRATFVDGIYRIRTSPWDVLLLRKATTSTRQNLHYFSPHDRIVQLKSSCKQYQNRDQRQSAILTRTRTWCIVARQKMEYESQESTRNNAVLL